MEKRKRRKAIKSCAFCRRRKLRCDQKKPRCSTCVARNLAECVYSQGLQHNASTETRELVPLPGFGESTTTYNVTIEPLAGASRNQLDTFFTLQCKESGRKVYYGPTSARTLMAKNDWGLLERFRQATTKIKTARIDFKKKNGVSMLRELQTIDTPQSIQQIVPVLPTYETILRCVHDFFDNPCLYPQNSGLDKRKVFQDLEEGLVVGQQLVPGVERAVVELKPGPKCNYYRLGVIFSILALTHYYEDLPLPLESFFVYLAGCNTAKAMYIERCQTFLLRFTYRLAHGYNGGDNSHLMLLVDNMINTAIYLGLNKDICILYRGQEATAGSLDSLQALWYWILLADFDIALNIGRPLRISPYDYDGPLVDHTDALYGVMGRFLKIARHIICDIHNKKRTPELDVHCETIITFIEHEFSPFELYTDPALMQIHKLPHMHILCNALSLLSTCYGLRWTALKCSTPSVKNGAVKAMLLSYSVISSISKFCFEQDRVKYSHMLVPECKNITPYLTGGISIWCTLFVRILMFFYGFAHSEMTLFESGPVFTQNSSPTDECDLSNLRGPEDRAISFSTYFNIACEKLDALAATNDPHMKMVLRRSRFYVLLMGKDKILRALTKTAVECRTNAETSWLTNSKGNQVITNLQSPEDSVEPILAPGKSVEQTGDGISTDFSLSQMQVNLMASPAADPGTAQMIADEFWQSYNLGWQEILDSAEGLDLISDFMV